MTNLVKLIRREQVEMLLPWWTTSTWSALLRYTYIKPRKVPCHGRIFPRIGYLNFIKKKKSHFWLFMLLFLRRPFHWCINCYCRTDIEEAKVISTLRHKSKFRISNFFEEKIKFLGFHVVVLVKTDTVLESSYGNMSAHKKIQLKAQN